MVMSRTSAVEVSIHAVSPALIMGAGVSAAACAKAAPPVARSAANAGKSERCLIRYFILRLLTDRLIETILVRFMQRAPALTERRSRSRRSGCGPRDRAG